MPGVNVPSKETSPMGTALGVVGGVVGGYLGNGPGAVAGAKLGQAIGGSGSLHPGPAAVQGSDSGPDAIGRRLGSQQYDPQVQLAQAQQALQQLPPEYSQTYGSTINAARQVAAQGS